jgi:hypothetical protein
VGAVAADEGRQTLEATLVAESSHDAPMTPAFPIQIMGIELTSRYAHDFSRTVTFDVVDFLSAETPGRWQPIDFDRNPDSWSERVVAIGQVTESPGITETPDQPDDALRLRIETGVGFSGVATLAVHRPWPAATNYPVVVTSRWLEESNRRLGDEMILDALGTGQSRAEIAGALDAFPTTDTGGGVVLVDLPTYQLIRYAPGRPIIETGEHWLAVSADAGEVAGTLLRAPLEARDVVGRDERFLNLTSDPVALVTIGALSIGFLAAAVFAAVGFAVSSTVSARERITEFALLRALGLSPRQLGSWMTLEQGVLVATSLAFGTLVGWLLTTFILPLVSVTQEGARPVPDVAIVYPWGSVLALEVGLVAVLAVIVTAMTLLLRRLGLGSLLRLGDE